MSWSAASPAAAAVAIPRAEVSVSIRALLAGRIEPRGVELEGARVTIMRAADGAFTLDLGTLGEEAAEVRPCPGRRCGARALANPGAAG